MARTKTNLTNTETAPTTPEVAATWLYESLNRRQRPEDVAETARHLLAGRLSVGEKWVLFRAGEGALSRIVGGYTSMLQEFASVVGMRRQVEKAGELFASAYPMETAMCDDPQAVADFVRHISGEIQKAFGQSDFKDDRMNREARQTAGLGDISRRRYNKLFRLLARMEAKTATLTREMKKAEFTKVGKSGLAYRLRREDLADTPTLAFVAYLAARKNLRSEFTIYGQAKAYDTVADTLFARLRRNSQTTNWFAVAHIHPTKEVLAHLTDTEKGALLGIWYSLLSEIGELLGEIWEASEIRRETMVVKRGNDSTTWNNTASAWNTARSAWLALLHAMGAADNVLSAVCPGKVLRLIAGDVTAWHLAAGHKPDPNLAVWNDLPLPWEVLRGEATCTRETVAQACRAHNVDAEKEGWLAPRPPGKPAAFAPTPELVHGVSVGSPALASVLKAAGFFGGKAKLSNDDTEIGEVTDAALLHGETLRQHHERLEEAEARV